MHDLLLRYLTLLFEQFKHDIDVFSNPWMYIPLLIPFFFYMVFFSIKWIILLIPIIIPLEVIRSIFSKR